MISLLPSHICKQLCITVCIINILSIGFIYYYTTKSDDTDSCTVKFDFFEESYMTFKSNLQWCHDNPFLRGYNQRLIIDLQRKWYRWNQAQLTRTFDFLKKYALDPNRTVSEFTQILYPTTDPLPCPYNNNEMKRYGSSRDTGKWLCGLETLWSNDSCIVYSLGSNNDFDFEYSIMAETPCVVHTFDCTSSPPLFEHDRLHFHKICLGEDSPLQNYIYPNSEMSTNAEVLSERTYMTFDQIRKRQKQKIVHILKMDIEGGEYTVFTDLLKNTERSDLPYQISFESHWWNKDIYHAILHVSLFSQLWRSGYRLLHHELNQYDETCVEWTLIRMFC